MKRQPSKKKSGGLTTETLSGEVAVGRIAPLYLFIGEEQYLAERALREILSTLDESLRPFNVSVFSIGADNGAGSKMTAAMVIDAANQMPMMTARRIVVVRDFDKIKEDEQELVLAYLNNPSPTTTVVFRANTLDKRRKVSAALLKACEVVTFDPLDDTRTMSWARDYLKPLGCQIEHGALRTLIGLTGTGLTRLANELDKLAAYSNGGGIIDSEAVQQLVGRAREHAGWELWGAIAARDRKRALRLMQRMLDDSDPLPVLGALASFYRKLIVGKEVIEGGGSKYDVSKATGQWSDNFVSSLRRTPLPVFVRGLCRIAEVDNSIKNSEATPRLLMEYLIVELTSPLSK